MTTGGAFFRSTLMASAVLAFITVLFIDQTPFPYGGYADQRFVLLVLSGLLTLLPLGLCALSTCPQIQSRFITIIAPSSALSAGFLVLSLPYSGQPYVWVEPGMYGFFFLAPVMVGAWASVLGAGERFVHGLLIIVAVGCGFYGLATVNVYLFALFDGVTNLVEFIPWGFVNIRYWSHIATWCLPLMPLAVLAGPLRDNRLWRYGMVLAAGLWWWILLLTAGRGSALGIAFGAVVVTLLFGRRAWPWLKVFLLYLLAGIVIWAVLSVVIPSLLAEDIQVRSIKTDSSGRMPLFIEAWTMSLQNFPFGMGPQSWLTHETLTDVYARSRHFGHPHNMYLMWAAEYGWVLIGLLAGVVVQATRYFWKKRSQVITEGHGPQVHILVGLTASVVAALFHAGVSAIFMAPGSMLVGLFVLMAFWAMIIPKQALTPLPAVPARNVRRLFAWFACFVLMVLWLLWLGEVWHYFEDMRLDEQTYSQEVGQGMLPRFWFHGNFPR